MERLKRKIVLLGLVAVGLLAIGFISMSNVGIVSVSAKQWTGLNNPAGVAIGDYDNDGLNELAFAECFGGAEGAGRVTVYKSDGVTVIKQWTMLNNPQGVAIGDYDNDGQNDLAFAERGGNVTVYKSDGTTVIKRWTGLAIPSGIAIGDYNNDGLNDLAIVEYDAGNVTVYKSDGVTIIKRITGFNSPNGVAIGDYDNDGLNDLAVSESWGRRLTVFKSDGTVIAQWAGLPGLAHGPSIGDYDNDGLNDIAFGQMDYNWVMVYKSDGKTMIRQWTANIPWGTAIGDYNNDGLNDIAFTEYTGNKVTVYYQAKLGTLARVAEPTIVTLRGTLTNASGYPIQSGSIRVTVEDSMGTQLWQDTFDNVIDNGRYNIPLGAKTTLMLIKGQIYNAILEVDANSPTFVSADVIYGDNNPAGDIIKFVAN